MAHSKKRSDSAISRRSQQSGVARNYTDNDFIDYLRTGALVLITAAVYWFTLRAGFIWDDDAMVTDNRFIRRSDGLLKFWFSTEPPDYFPLVSTLLWFQWRAWGMNAMGYHLIQMLLHALNCILLWRVALRLKIPSAWWAGVLFAVHPVNVETVAWITETKNTLPMSLYLGAILLYLRYRADECRLAYFGALFLFMLALLGKTSVVMLPVVLLIIEWWRFGSITHRDIIRTAPFFGLSLVLGLVTVWFQLNRAIVHTVIREDGFASRLAIAGKAVWFYLYKAIVPVNLSFVYPRWSLDGPGVLDFVPLVLLVAFAAALYVLRHRIGRGPFAALACYVVSLLPVLGFINIYFMRYSLVADHWQYVALAALAVFVAGGVAELVTRLGRNQRQYATVAAAVVCLALSIMSAMQTRQYASMEVLFNHVLHTNRSAWIAHNNLGIIKAQRGDLDGAMDHYTAALKLNPRLSDAHLNIGNVYAARQQWDQAIASYQKSLQIQSYYRTHNALGEAYLRTGKRDLAIEQFQRSLAQVSDFWLAHRNLGDTYLEMGQTDSALAAYNNAIRFRPRDPDLRNCLARAHLRMGRQDLAIAELRNILDMYPQYVPGYANLSALLVKANDREGAVQVIRKGLQFSPDNTQLQQELARLTGK